MLVLHYKEQSGSHDVLPQLLQVLKLSWADIAQLSQLELRQGVASAP